MLEVEPTGQLGGSGLNGNEAVAVCVEKAFARWLLQLRYPTTTVCGANLQHVHGMPRSNRTAIVDGGRVGAYRFAVIRGDNLTLSN